MIPENSEQQWFASLLQDEEAALGYFFQTHFPSLLGYVCPIVNDDIAEAEDIISSAFLNLWDARKKLDSPEHLKNFLYLAVKRKALSHLRKQKTLTDVQQEWMAVYGKEEAETPDLRDSELLKAMVLQEIYQKAGTLSPACKQVFELHYRDGKQVEEISKLLLISPQTVYNQLSKAVGILRKMLKEKKLI
ncbi:MAG TPA: sigma-70 family RNA polymerase sigma factor [Puia sp.]|nr:sigma-70 family RNA polymerase sigma factor [Puia sp.]